MRHALVRHTGLIQQSNDFHSTVLMQWYHKRNRMLLLRIKLPNYCYVTKIIVLTDCIAINITYVCTIMHCDPLSPKPSKWYCREFPSQQHTWLPVHTDMQSYAGCTHCTMHRNRASSIIEITQVCGHETKMHLTTRLTKQRRHFTARKWWKGLDMYICLVPSFILYICSWMNTTVNNG